MNEEFCTLNAFNSPLGQIKPVKYEVYDAKQRKHRIFLSIYYMTIYQKVKLQHIRKDTVNGFI